MKTKLMVTMAMCTAILFAVQVGLAFLPNIELVTLLIIIYTQIYKKKVFFIIYAFVLLEGIFYGFGIWWINYLYIWPLLAVAVLLIKKESFILWSILSGFYGLSYGFLCSIPYYIAGGVHAGFAYWITGIPFDLLHCIGNFAVCLVLYKPLHYTLSHLVKKAPFISV